MIFTRRLRSLAAALVVLVSACADRKDDYVERPVEDLYNEAMDLVDKDEYYRAAKAFDEVERQHPYSVWATKAQMMGAYVLYERNKYDEAVIALDRFIQLHPGNKDVAYAYYLKGLCYYEQIVDVARDQKTTEMALRSLQEVSDRFPASSFARDAKLKIDLARDHLAGKEMAVGRYYLNIKHHLAALNRFKTVVEQFQTTTHVPEALHRMVEIYTILGLDGEAKRTAAVLGHNFPGSDWYEDTYAVVSGTPRAKKDDGWVDSMKFWKSSDAEPVAVPPPAKRNEGWLDKLKFW
jgi:outer membrane protein assembly factor BamD